MPKRLKPQPGQAAKRSPKVAAPPSGTRTVQVYAPSESPRNMVFESSPAFLLVWKPRDYIQDVEGRVFPHLMRMFLEPGLNGVDARGGWMVAKAEQERRGRIVIPMEAARPEDTPDGQAGYLRATRTARGDYHHTPWQRLEAQAGRGVIVAVDREGYLRWLDALVERGITPAVHPAVLRELRHRHDATMDTCSARDSIGAQRSLQLAKTQAAALDLLIAGAPA